MESMAARSVLLIRPKGFASDGQPAVDNSFQATDSDLTPMEIQSRAAAEFEVVASALRDNGVETTIFDGEITHPDDTFPNNWFSTFPDGTLVLYPMRALTRRLERREDIVEWLLDRYPQLVDMSGMEDRDLFLEGTGSLVLDRANQIAFAGRSQRTNEQLVRNWCADFEYEPILFDTAGPGGKPIYHTNVLLSIGTGFAVACTECIVQPAPVLSALLTGGKDVIEITWGQMMSFCANVLELEGRDKILMMSRTAHEAFSPSQLETIEKFARPVVVDIPTIEKYGGGGVRCMIAELY